MTTESLLALHFPHWQQYLSEPTHLSNSAVFDADSFVVGWQNRRVPEDEDDVDIGVEYLAMSTLQHEIDQ
jgi:hypothetical protein